MSTKAELEHENQRLKIINGDWRDDVLEMKDEIKSLTSDKRELKAHCAGMAARIEFLEGYCRRIEDEEQREMQPAETNVINHTGPTGVMHGAGITNFSDRDFAEVGERAWFDI